MFEEKIAEVNASAGVQSTEITYEKRVYSVEEIIDILCVSKSTAYNLVASKVFHSVRVGGQYRISKKSFDRWLEGNTEDDIDG